MSLIDDDSISLANDNFEKSERKIIGDLIVICTKADEMSADIMKRMGYQYIGLVAEQKIWINDSLI